MIPVHLTNFRPHNTNPSSETPDAQRDSVNKIAQSIFKGISTAFRFISGAVPALVLLPFRVVHIATSSLLDRIVNIRDNSLIKTAAKVLAIVATSPLFAIAFLGIQQKKSWDFANNKEREFTPPPRPPRVVEFDPTNEEEDDDYVPPSFPHRSETTPIIPTYQQETYIVPSKDFNDKFKEFKSLPSLGNRATMEKKYSLLIDLINLLKESCQDPYEGNLTLIRRSIELDNHLKSDGMKPLVAMIKQGMGSDQDTYNYVLTIPDKIDIIPSFESMHRAFAPNTLPSA